ncbi:MAG: methyltransferase [Desulfurella sp.]
MELELCDFKFIQLYQPKFGYRFSFEPFILTDIDLPKHIKFAADFGSGCGIIAILLSKKFHLEKIFAVETNVDYIKIIQKNMCINNAKNIEIIDGIEKLPDNTLELVLSNPPYYTKSSFRISKKFEMQKFETLPLSQMLEKITPKIKKNGLFRLSFHPTRLFELFTELSNKKFGIKTIQPIYGTKKTISKVCIIEAKKFAKTYITIKSPIFLEDYKLSL